MGKDNVLPVARTFLMVGAPYLNILGCCFLFSKKISRSGLKGCYFTMDLPSPGTRIYRVAWASGIEVSLKAHTSYHLTDPAWIPTSLLRHKTTPHAVILLSPAFSVAAGMLPTQGPCVGVAGRSPEVFHQHDFISWQAVVLAVEEVAVIRRNRQEANRFFQDSNLLNFSGSKTKTLDDSR
jgi:hypothetical protein